MKDDAKREVLYQGIAARAFERRFQLADHVVVTGAASENGLLHIDLVREVPEAQKPRDHRDQQGRQDDRSRQGADRAGCVSRPPRVERKARAPARAPFFVYSNSAGGNDADLRLVARLGGCTQVWPTWRSGRRGSCACVCASGWGSIFAGSGFASGAAGALAVEALLGARPEEDSTFGSGMGAVGADSSGFAASRGAGGGRGGRNDGGPAGGVLGAVAADFGLGFVETGAGCEPYGLTASGMRAFVGPL